MKILFYIIIFIIVFAFAKGVVLDIISKILGALIFPLNLISILIKYRNNSQYWRKVNEYLYNDAFETDIFLHVNFRAFWNLTSSKGGTKFGSTDMTLSAMIGLKKEQNTLTGLLWLFYYILYAIDYSEWFNGGHCKMAYQLYKTHFNNE